ncbi:MAG: ArnT family glycosyltransferase [Candidatus Binatia bacterium]
MKGRATRVNGSRTSGCRRLESRGATAALLGCVVLISLALRLWHLGSVPTVFFHDECDNTVNAIEILQGKGPGLLGLDWKPQPALAVHEIALTLRVIGPSVAAIRLPSALLSVLALVPFFFLARRVTGALSATLATLLLACNVGYLHFSRSGWENVQICLYTLLAMEAVTRAEEGEHWWWWAVAGMSAALGTYVYFAGRAVIAFLFLYAPLVVLHARGRHGRAAGGLALMGLAFLLAVAPLYPTLRAHWEQFNQRTKAVLITAELPADAGPVDVARKALTNGTWAVQAFWRSGVNNEPRYFPLGRPFLDWVSRGFLLVGLIASLGRLRLTALWWLAFIVPFALTQMLTTGVPNLARGIALVPIAYLFAALGMRTFEGLLRRWRWIMQAALALLVLVSATVNSRTYFKWASSPELALPLEPAVQLADFQQWWTVQNQWVRENKGFLNVGQWLALYAGARNQPPAPGTASALPEVVPGDGAPIEPPREASGTIYRGSISRQPYTIDLGTITLQEGILEVHVFTVLGADCVYDYLEAVADDGQKFRVEAEDPRYTSGDHPTPTYVADDHWWLQNFEAFSGGKGLVAMKAETVPPLTTRLHVPPGTYHVHLGSFTGDPANGVFAIQVDMHEAGTPAPAAP